MINKENCRPQNSEQAAKWHRWQLLSIISGGRTFAKSSNLLLERTVKQLQIVKWPAYL